jgi:hypothetical protein
MQGIGSQEDMFFSPPHSPPQRVTLTGDANCTRTTKNVPCVLGIKEFEVSPFLLAVVQDIAKKSKHKNSQKWNQSYNVHAIHTEWQRISPKSTKNFTNTQCESHESADDQILQVLPVSSVIAGNFELQMQSLVCICLLPSLFYVNQLKALVREGHHMIFAKIPVDEMIRRLKWM